MTDDGLQAHFVHFKVLLAVERRYLNSMSVVLESALRKDVVLEEIEASVRLVEAMRDEFDEESLCLQALYGGVAHTIIFPTSD